MHGIWVIHKDRKEKTKEKEKKYNTRLSMT
jgi:hypothetical protein